ncbi:MAG TPA: hypothetical protein PLI45_03685 [Candidatus Woesebacteria bacterium]|nr:hypothetical protein [Candidatus Woesebacteria bacterium]
MKIIEGLDYYSLRVQLFFNSYIAFKLAINAREKLGITRPFVDEKALYEWSGKNHLDLANEFANTWKSTYKENTPLDPHVFTMMNWFILSRLLKDEIRLATKLNLPPELLVDFVVFDRKPNGLIAERNFVIASAISPITQGTYIPISINTSKEDVFNALTDAQEFLSDLTPDKSISRVLKRKRHDISSQDRSKIKSFLRVEESLIMLNNDKNRGEYNTLISAAIERATGNLIEEKYGNLPEDELEEIYLKQTEKLQAKLKRNYYDVVERYQLPTPKYWSGIFRLIAD